MMKTVGAALTLAMLVGCGTTSLQPSVAPGGVQAAAKKKPSVRHEIVGTVLGVELDAMPGSHLLAIDGADGLGRVVEITAETRIHRLVAGSLMKASEADLIAGRSVTIQLDPKAPALDLLPPRAIEILIR